MTWAVFDDSHIRAIGEMLSTGSERVVAVVGGAILEDTVERTLKERLRDDPSIIKSQFNHDKPLGAIGVQIELLYLLHAIDRPTRDALKSIASIRNFFAHDLSPSFDSPDKDFEKSIGRLSLHENKTHYPDQIGRDSNVPIEPVLDRRTRFLVSHGKDRTPAPVVRPVRLALTATAPTNRRDCRKDLNRMLKAPAPCSRAATL